MNQYGNLKMKNANLFFAANKFGNQNLVKKAKTYLRYVKEGWKKDRFQFCNNMATKILNPLNNRSDRSLSVGTEERN